MWLLHHKEVDSNCNIFSFTLSHLCESLGNAADLFTVSESFAAVYSFFFSLFNFFLGFFFPLSLGVLRIICHLNILMTSTPVILLCLLLVISSDAFIPLPSNSHFVYTRLSVFIANLHNLILEKRSHRNKETAYCNLWLLLQSTCLQTGFIYIGIEWFGHLKQSLITNSYQSTAWLVWFSLGCNGEENKAYSCAKTIMLMKAV